MKAWDEESVRENAITEGLPAIWRNQFDLFYNRMRKHDTVIILVGWDSVLGIAKVMDEEPTYDDELEEDFFPHTRNIKWKCDYNFENRHMIPPVIGFVNTLHIVEEGTDRWRSLTAVRFP